MILNRWRFAVLSLFALVLVAGGVAFATEEEAPVDRSQATGEVRADTEADHAVQSGTVDELAARTEVATVASEGLETVQPQLLLPAAPPPSLQTLVDERRDQLRERREAQFDAISGRYAYMSPWMVTYDRSMELYQDTLRQLHRLQRDYSRRNHDTWMDAMCPWSRPQRDWSRMRSYLMQTEQLDRQEARDAWLATRPYTFAGPIPW